MFAGISSFKELFLKIISPEDTNYTIVTVIIVITSIIVKCVFGRYVKKEGEQLSSSSLVASGIDAINDSYISSSTLVAIVFSLLFNINIEGYIGLFISVVILKASIQILKDTVDEIIGVRADSR